MEADEKWYAGRGDGEVYVIQGMAETPLRHYVRHSPDGFSWGYGGSGPADLARCILIDALGVQSQCATCEGTGTVVFINGEDLALPRAEREYEYGDPTSAFHGRSYRCAECDEGFAIEPATYQAFKFDVVARFSVGRPWSMPRSQVLAWQEAYAMKKEHA